ncbi:MAG TPA: farnesyl diphosphate synthase [Fimbriimonas sp.]
MVQEKLEVYARQVDRRLEELLPPAAQMPAPLHEAMRYSCLAPGKRLRPALCLAAAEAVGGREADALDAACAIEMVHCFSLIHDDLPAIDNDDLRRGIPTCHVRYGEATAILAGDALFALAFDVLANARASAERRIRAIAALTRAAGSDGLVGGETTDILCEGQEVDPPTLRFIHTKKTGALISASCVIGAIMGGGAPNQMASLGKYGESVGLAFQIADDLLNETSTSEALGKSAGSDKLRGKATYPALFGIEASRRAALAMVEKAREALTGFHSEFLDGIAEYSVERMR